MKLFANKYKCFATVAAAMATTILLAGNSPEIAAQQSSVQKASLPQSAAAPQGRVQMRRLTEAQYRNVIADVFGPNISVGGVFNPLTRTEGLLAAGATIAEDTPASFANDVRKARSISTQVVDPKNRDILIPCTPKKAAAPDDRCAKKFYAMVGRLLYRRPMAPQELTASVDLARAATTSLGDFYGGLAAGLSGMLQAVDFRYITDFTAVTKDGAIELDAYSKAQRLSFFLWNTTPDDELLTAVEKGEFDTRAGLERQVTRMLASPRLENGVRAFFADMLSFDNFETLTKDAALYPSYSQNVAVAAQEQTLRSVVDLLVTRNGDYRDIFTTRDTFINAPLGMIYKIPVDQSEGEWVRHEIPADDPRIGILAQLSFLALHSHPGESSSTLRGRALRELLLCQRVPDPPANVDFQLFNDPNSPNKTARDRLNAHSTNPVCGGCHKIMDPLGLTMENFDSIGQFRATENGAPINTEGFLNGVKFTGVKGLAEAVRNDPAAPSCLVNRVYTYALGRAPGRGDRQTVDSLNKGFADGGYRLLGLLRTIALSDALYTVAPAEAARSKSASTNSDNGGKS